MNIFSKRPLLLSIFIFIFFTTFCTVLSPSINFLLAAVFLTLLCGAIIALITIYFIKHRFSHVILSLALCSAFALSAFVSSYCFFDKKLSNIESLTNEKNVVAQVEECTFSAPYLTSYTAKIKSINGEKVNFKASIYSEFETYFAPGETVIADMIFFPFTAEENGYDSRTANISDGVLISAQFSDYESFEHDGGFAPYVSLIRLRASIADKIDDNFSDAAPLIKALLIGDKADIEAKTKSDFSRLGISHILSISGTHFSVLLGMLAFLFSMVGINKKIVYILLIPTALFYIGLSGFSFSVCRAGLMSLITFWGFLCGRQKDSYTALFASVFIILIFAPYSVFSISLWLSFTATFTILIVFELLYEKLAFKGSGWFKKAIGITVLHITITVAISFSTLPIISIYFGEISLISPLTNCILVPIFQLFLYIIPFATLFSDFSLPVTITEAYCKYILTLIDKISSIHNITISIKPKFVLIIAILGIFATIILIAVPLKKKLFVALPSIISIGLIAISLVAFYHSRYDKTFVSYFNTGKSDAIVLTDANKTTCIDITAGTSSASYYTQNVVHEHYSTELSAYIFTHYRSKHVKVFEKLASRMKIKKVFLPIATNGSSAEYMDSVEEIVKKYNIEIEYYEYNSTIKAEQCEITVLEPQFISRTSHEIISVYISTEQDDFLYLGSSFSDCKFDFSKYVTDAEYIVFGQHYPKVKNRFDIETNAKLIYGNSEIYSMSDIKTEGTVLNNGDQYKIVLK